MKGGNLGMTLCFLTNATDLHIRRFRFYPHLPVMVLSSICLTTDGTKILLFYTYTSLYYFYTTFILLYFYTYTSFFYSN